jgi:glutamyl-tRNA reductase
MAGLSVSTVSRRGASSVVVASRTEANARRLADQYDGSAVPLGMVGDALREADVLVSCTGATGVVLPLSVVAAARADAEQELVVVDLALPHDVDPAVAELPGVSLIDLARLAAEVNHDESEDIAAVREIVAQEITAFLAARSSATVTPTVVALRTMATGIVEAEMERLSARLPGLDQATRAEVEQAVRRVADKLLHQPTVRVKELANETGAVSYATALAELFSLDPDAVEAVTSAAREGL